MQLFGRRQDKQLDNQDEKRRKQATDAVRSALLFLQGRLYGQAASELRRAVNLDPSSTTAHAYLGMVLQRLGELDEAAQEMSQAVALAPEDDGLRRTYGTVLESLGQREAASAEYQAAVQLNPSDPLAHAALGSLLIGSGELAAGEARLRQALALEKRDPVSLADLATAQYQQGNLQGAVDSLRIALGLLADVDQPPIVRLGAMPAPPDTVAATQAGYQHRLGRLLAEIGDLKAAEQAMRAALTALPSEAPLLADLARVFVRQARLNDALALYGRAEKDYPEQRLRYQQDLSALVTEHGIPANAAATAETPSRAPEVTVLKGATPPAEDRIAQLERQLREDPDNRALRRELSVALLRAGRVAEALEQARVVEQLLSHRGGTEQPAG